MGSLPKRARQLVTFSSPFVDHPCVTKTFFGRGCENPRGQDPSADEDLISCGALLQDWRQRTTSFVHAHKAVPKKRALALVHTANQTMAATSSSRHPTKSSELCGSYHECHQSCGGCCSRQESGGCGGCGLGTRLLLRFPLIPARGGFSVACGLLADCAGAFDCGLDSPCNSDLIASFCALSC